jgi:phosphoribosylformimino-5-aminoimidazole carboxamide ribotide isomerase
MNFRPCIDIHNGSVKQIVGGSLSDIGDYAKENFVSEYDAAWYASYYKEAGLKGGHVIILNNKDSEYYEASKNQAINALKAYPGGLMVGGGITTDNALEFLDAGASHVVVTSFVFHNGILDYERLESLVKRVGKSKLVLDLSCRKKDNDYFVVTDRWQNFTDEKSNAELLNKLAAYCDEYLIHAVDVEGKKQGVEEEVVKLLADYSPIPVTYAGGVGSFKDLEVIKEIGKERVDVTIGSALSIFGGNMNYSEVLEFFNPRSGL